MGYLLEQHHIEIDNELKKAIQYYQSGQLQKAEEVFKKILELEPENFDSLCLLGAIAIRRARPDIAEDYIREAIQLSPGKAILHNNLGVAMKDQGRMEEAASCYSEALRLDPDCSEASYNMGKLFRDMGKMEQAIECYRKALDNNPDFPDAYNSMGIAFTMIGNPAEAITCFENALKTDQSNPAAYNNMGNVFKGQGKFDQAIDCYRKALEINPNYARALNNIGVTLNNQNRYGEAVSYFQKALKANHDDLNVLSNMGATYHKMGRLGAALSCHKRALELNPDNPTAHSNLIFSLHYDPDITGEELFEECRRFEKRHGRPKGHFTYKNIPNAKRRLRIGYFSADYYGHAAALLLEPLISSHDKDAVEIYCYAEVEHPDAFTEKFKKYADHWRSSVGLSDKDLAAQINSDEIDILVDWTGYSKNNRLTALVYKPAPIQVSTMIGHGGATGLDAFDYVMSDPYLTPFGFERHFKEKIIRLPNHIMPFQPLSQWPDVYPLQAAKTKKVIFGSFGEPARNSMAGIDIWRRVIERVPESSLLLKNPAFADRETLDYWKRACSSFGDRILFEDVPGGWGKNMDVYSRVDIVLDSIPVCGHTSSMIPLWMGVPVISLAGGHAIQRFGASVLSNIGLSDLLAKSADEFVEKAARLANNIDALNLLRMTLRERMKSSPLCRPRLIASDIENAYRRIWVEWCKAD